MIPIGDTNPRQRFPVVTVLVIVLNFLVFIYQQTLPSEDLNQFILSAGMVPFRVTQAFGPGAASSLITCIFMHGSWMHILGNMLYLWIFGDNIEDRMGPLPFAIYYVAMGIIASLAQIAIDPLSKIPTIGASGAVAGVLGTYLMLYPRTRVRTLVIVFRFLRMIEMPAIVVLGFWFVLQLFNGVSAIADTSMGGVAWFAHIGGFVAGVIVGWVLGGQKRPR